MFLPARVEGEPLPGLSSIHRQHLRGGGRVPAPNQEEPLLQYCAGVVQPGVEGVLVVKPAGPGQEVHGGAVGHVTGKGGEAAAGPRGPQLH